MREKMIRITLLLIAPIAFGIFIFQTDIVMDKEDRVFAEEMGTETIEAITHQDIIEGWEQFDQFIYQEVNENYQVIHFDSKKELLSAFRDAIKEDFATEMIDYYFTESDQGLYLIPTEGPPEFIPTNDYHMLQLSETDVVIQQNNISTIYGEYKIEVHFTYDTAWKIAGIQVE